ncbi:MAG: hypothetical protein GY796_26080 [Chloroflexi bacterium]|nr:hypothetical protein [Chloroflexota bacterium]
MLGRTAVLSARLADFVFWPVLTFSAVYAEPYQETAEMPLIARQTQYLLQ